MQPAIPREQWIAITAALVSLVVRALKAGSSVWPLSLLPPKARPLLAVLLGLAAGALDSVATGTPWRVALVEGLTSGALAVVAHQLGVEWLAGGREPFARPALAPSAPEGDPPPAPPADEPPPPTQRDGGAP